MITKTQRLNTPLRKSHPSLFKSLLVKAAFLIIAGGFLLAGKATYLIEETVLHPNGRPNLVPVQFWGAIFIVIAIMLIYGITHGLSRYKWARRSMIAAAALCGIFAIGYCFAFAQGYTHRIFAPLLWSYMTLQFIIWAGEPAFNPLSSAISNNGEAGHLGIN